MLPSMPILFSKESQDAFGNRIEPSTSFFSQNLGGKIDINPEPPPALVQSSTSKVTPKDSDLKSSSNITNEILPLKKENPLEAALVKSYYTKVQSRFASNHMVPTNKFVQFQSILKLFDPTKETPVDLYKKIEQLFGDEHKDIIEEFLLFLKPGEAAQVGRFMDHFAMKQITNFIALLQKTFARKPTVLRKIMRALTKSLNSGSCEELKTRVLPHLRSSPRLTDAFKALFPDERPPDCLYETGVDTIRESFLTTDSIYDEWELEDEGDNKRKVDVKDHLDITYLHGRVFIQNGRILRAACVSYPYSKEPYRVHCRRLASNNCDLSQSESEDESTSPKRNKATAKMTSKKNKKQPKSPLKSVKDVNDNTKIKDSVTNSPKITKAKTNIKKCKERKDSESKTDLKKKGDKNLVERRVEFNKNEPKVKQAKIEETEAKEEVKCNNWTREEDKTMLEVLKGEAGSDQVFGRIRELLPHRSIADIKERFCHVMTLLQEMAVGEVT